MRTKARTLTAIAAAAEAARTCLTGGGTRRPPRRLPPPSTRAAATIAAAGGGMTARPVPRMAKRRSTRAFRSGRRGSPRSRHAWPSARSRPRGSIPAFGDKRRRHPGGLPSADPAGNSGPPLRAAGGFARRAGPKGQSERTRSATGACGKRSTGRASLPMEARCLNAAGEL